MRRLRRKSCRLESGVIDWFARVRRPASRGIILSLEQRVKKRCIDGVERNLRENLFGLSLTMAD